MAQRESCNHGYGLQVIRCPECGAQIGSRCPRCSYVGRCDDHGVSCSLAAPPEPEAPGRRGR